MTRSSRFIEYIKVHLISLEQDEEEIKHFFNTYEGDFDTDEYRQMEIKDIINLGELKATRHILSVALDIMEQSNQGEWAINE